MGPRVPLVVVLVAACSASAPGTDSAVPGDTGRAVDVPAATDTAPPPDTGASARDAGPLGAPVMGIATYYAATGEGNCGFPASPGDLHVAAMNHPQWDGSAVCGMCVRVTGPRGTTTVRIVDRCPECLTGHLDLSREAFAEVAEVAAGRVPITWQPVPCAVTGPMVYHFKDGSSQWWAGIQVRHHRVPVRRLEVQLGGEWRDVPRESYNYFVASGLGPGPFTLRVTASTGQQVVETGIALHDDGDSPGTQQFE